MENCEEQKKKEHIVLIVVTGECDCASCAAGCLTQQAESLLSAKKGSNRYKNSCLVRKQMVRYRIQENSIPSSKQHEFSPHLGTVFLQGRF
jgi:hypothetical protein